MPGPTEDNPQPAPPTWQIKARAPASAEWQEYRIAAHSLRFAAAILRHRGFVVDPSGARVVDAPAIDPQALHPVPGPLHCTHCGYELDGLPVHRATITCPECAHPQVVLAFRPAAPEDAVSQSRDQRWSKWWPFGMGCMTSAVLVLAAIAMLFALFVL